ncbi:MAG: hypothetical protein HGA84_02860 [Syntrophobacteraceae bacterium]|nr:hypothetical protein [Syntrophobacteraceae bacterium]
MELLKQGQAGFDEKEDVPGPVPLAVIAEINVKEMKKDAAKGKGQPQKGDAKPEGEAGDQNPRKAFLLVAGDSDFITNSNFNLSGNGDLFLNMVNFLAEEETLITIESRDKGGRPLLLSQGQASAMFWMVLVLVPLMVLAAGFAVYRVRRGQR